MLEQGIRLPLSGVFIKSKIRSKERGPFCSREQLPPRQRLLPRSECDGVNYDCRVQNVYAYSSETRLTGEAACYLTHFKMQKKIRSSPKYTPPRDTITHINGAIVCQDDKPMKEPTQTRMFCGWMKKRPVRNNAGRIMKRWFKLSMHSEKVSCTSSRWWCNRKRALVDRRFRVQPFRQTRPLTLVVVRVRLCRGLCCSISRRKTKSSSI